MKSLLLSALLAAVGIGAVFSNGASGGQHSVLAQAPTASQKPGKGTGLIQQVDREKGTVTIKHGPLQGLNMPAMTMSFPVKDKAMLANLQPLQKVEFDLTYDGKDYTITRIK